MKRIVFIAAFLIPVFSMGGCLTSSCGTSHAPIVTLITQEGRVDFEARIAETPRERQVGLMGETELGEREGMLFIFPSLSLGSFWMKDTPLSLDIIFISEEALVLQIAADTVPFSAEMIVPTQPYRYVFEVLAGTAAAIGLQVGDLLDLPDL